MDLEQSSEGSNVSEDSSLAKFLLMPVSWRVWLHWKCCKLFETILRVLSAQWQWQWLTKCCLGTWPIIESLGLFQALCFNSHYWVNCKEALITSERLWPSHCLVSQQVDIGMKELLSILFYRRLPRNQLTGTFPTELEQLDRLTLL